MKGEEGKKLTVFCREKTPIVSFVDRPFPRIEFMLQLKNTINCPACGGILRVSVRVMNDGNEYVYYLCGQCQDVAREGADGWKLQGDKSVQIPELIRQLQALASKDWQERSRSREPRPGKKNGS